MAFLAWIAIACGLIGLGLGSPVSCGPCICSRNFKTMICNNLGLTSPPSVGVNIGLKVVQINLQGNNIGKLELEWVGTFPNLREVDLRNRRSEHCPSLDFDLTRVRVKIYLGKNISSYFIC